MIRKPSTRDRSCGHSMERLGAGNWTHEDGIHRSEKYLNYHQYWLKKLYIFIDETRTRYYYLFKDWNVLKIFIYQEQKLSTILRLCVGEAFLQEAQTSPDLVMVFSTQKQQSTEFIFSSCQALESYSKKLVALPKKQDKINKNNNILR